jgi:hypothetical protein
LHDDRHRDPLQQLTSRPRPPCAVASSPSALEASYLAFAPSPSALEASYLAFAPSCSAVARTIALPRPPSVPALTRQVCTPGASCPVSLTYSE